MNRIKNFDDIISGKLNKISAELRDNSWEVFEKHMQADTDLDMLSQDMIFDDLIREKSKKMPLGTNPSSHWQVLKDNLETISLRKNEIWKSRILEAIAVVIFILSFQKWTEKNHTSAHSDSIAHTGILKNEPKNKVYALQLNDIIPSEKHNPVQANQYSFFISSSDSHSNTVTDFNLNFKEVEWIRAFEEKVMPIADKQNNVLYSDQTKVSSLLKSSLNKVTNAKPKAGNVLALDVSTKLEAIDDIYSYKQNEFDAYLSDRTSLIQEGDNISTDIAPKTVKKDKVQRSVALFYAKDINLINTPFDKVYSVASYTKEAFNTSIGAALSFKKENLSWEGSLRYTTLSYVPQIIKEEHTIFADRFFETSLDRISFSILSSQLMLKYHFIDSRDLSIYLAAGTGVNLITDSDFEITTAIRQGRPGNRSQDQDLRLFDEKSFNQGIFEGGKVRDNFFITGAFGIGAEQHLFHNLNLFTQAIYNRHLLSAERGVGPNKDKIHTLSVQAGIIFTLN